MKYIAIIGMVLLLLPLASAVTYNQKPILNIIHNEIVQSENTETGDNNVYDVYCNFKYTNVCEVYRTEQIHSVLIGE